MLLYHPFQHLLHLVLVLVRLQTFSLTRQKQYHQRVEAGMQTNRKKILNIRFDYLTRSISI
jgi:hypothetical protein